MFHKILVPLDGSALAEKALPYATSLAQKYGAEIILVQALPPMPTLAVAEYGHVPFDYGLILDREEARANEYLGGIKEQLLAEEVPTRIAVLKDRSVAEAIVDTAVQEGVELIVKTTHGRSGFSRWVYGSVATKVLQQAPCPVFLIRITEED